MRKGLPAAAKLPKLPASTPTADGQVPAGACLFVGAIQFPSEHVLACFFRGGTWRNLSDRGTIAKACPCVSEEVNARGAVPKLTVLFFQPRLWLDTPTVDFSLTLSSTQLPNFETSAMHGPEGASTHPPDIPSYRPTHLVYTLGITMRHWTVIHHDPWRLRWAPGTAVSRDPTWCTGVHRPAASEQSSVASPISPPSGNRRGAKL